MTRNHSQNSDLLRSAYAEILQLKEKKRAVSTEPIAIVGVGCRFPGGATSTEKFWELLVGETNAIQSVPEVRWDPRIYYSADAGSPGTMYTVEGGFLTEGADKFDADFFRISAQEARYMDPQHRLLLEVMWEAMESACLPATAMNDKDVGVFVGACSSDYQAISMMNSGVEGINPYSGIGTALSSSAGRISHFLHAHGPSITVDTACSSSLVALHLACQSLRQKESEIALAGGVNLLLSPFTTIAFSKARMLSPSGRCHTFDVDADGYVRGEGCGVVVLKRLQDALDSGDPIKAVIRGTAVNHDGGSAGLTVPNSAAQRAVIRKAFENAGRTIDDVGYFEAHGTGTPLGDPIEIRALSSCLTSTDHTNLPFIGSVKTNIGHLEGAAGIAGVIKAVLALEKGLIPRHLNFRKLNPYIAESGFPFKIPQQLEPWPPCKRRLAGVSSFGFNGTNAHVVLEAAPETMQRASLAADREEVMVFSTRTRSDLNHLVDIYISWLRTNASASLSDVCYALAVGRTPMKSKLAILARTVGEAQTKLEAFVAGDHSEDVYYAETETSAIRGKTKVSFAREAAEAYAAGSVIDWSDWFGRQPAHWYNLPSYPFERNSYWISAKRNNTRAVEDLASPANPSPFISCNTPSAPPETDIFAQTFATSADEQATRISSYLYSKLSGLLGSTPEILDINGSKFDELGIDSLMASTFLDDIRTDLGIHLYPQELVEHSTLSELSAYIESRVTHQSGNLIRNYALAQSEWTSDAPIDQISLLALGEAPRGDENHYKETWIESRGRKSCVCEWGPENGPAVLLIHGLFDQGAIWDEIAGSLAQLGYRVLAPDLVGHGRSDHLPAGTPYELVEFLADLEQIVIDRNCRTPLVVGHSMGAALAAIFAALWPALVTGLILLEPPGSLPDPATNPLRYRQGDIAKNLRAKISSLSIPLRHNALRGLEDAAARLRRTHPSLPDERARFLARRILKSDDTQFYWRWDPVLKFRSCMELSLDNYHDLLKSIQVPTTVLYGQTSNFLTGSEVTLHKKLLPNALHLSVPSGHHIPFDAAGRVVDSVLELSRR